MADPRVTIRPMSQDDWSAVRMILYPRALLTCALVTLACGGPTEPSGERLVVRLTLSPPTIRAFSSDGRWTAHWTVNLEAALEFPPESHGVLLPFATGPVFVDSIQASIAGTDGRVLERVVDDASAIRAAHGGSSGLTVEGGALQVEQQATYTAPGEPPSASELTIVVQLRAPDGAHERLVTRSVVHEQACGYRGGPPC